MPAEDAGEPWVGFEQTRIFRSAKNRELLSYWSNLAGDRPYPSWRDVDLMALHRLATGLVVKDVEGDGAVYRNRYWGRRLTEVTGIEATGLKHSEMYNSDMADKMSQLYHRVQFGEFPGRLVARVTTVPGRSHFKYEAIFLPLGGEGDGIRHIISHFDFDYRPTVMETRMLR